MIRVFDDRRLAAMATQPPHDLVPILVRARGMAPLIVALSILPALMVMQYRTFSKSSIVLFLRALGCADSVAVQEWMEPGLERFGETVAIEPPLSAWIEAIWMRLLPFAAGSSQTFLCLLATSCIILAVFAFTGPWLGQRFAVLASVLLCFHPILLTVTRMSPRSILGIACLMWSVAFWFDALRQMRRGSAFKRVIGAGVAWGLGWLSAGPASIVLLPITLIIVTAGIPQERAPLNEGESTFSRPFLLQLFFVWLVTGVLVGGWWPVVIYLEHGQRAITSWLAFDDSWMGRRGGYPIDRDPWWAGTPFMVAWVLIGIVRKFWSPRSTDVPFQYLIGGWIITLAMLFCVPGSPLKWDSVAHALLLIPLILVAAAGLEGLITRDVSLRWVCLSVAISGGLSVYVATGRTGLAIVMALLILVAAGWWWTTSEWTGRLRFPWRNEDLVMILQMIVIVWIGGQFVFAGKYLLRRTTEDMRLDSFWARLSAVARPDRVILLVPDPALPSAVEVMIHRRFPRIEVQRISTQNRELALAATSTIANHILLVEWVRRPNRLPAEIIKTWRVLPVGDPLIVQNRRLTIYQLNPHGLPAKVTLTNKVNQGSETASSSKPIVAPAEVNIDNSR